MDVLEAKYEIMKEKLMKTYKEEKRRVKRCIIIYQSKKEVNEQIEKKIKKNESECMWEQELF